MNIQKETLKNVIFENLKEYPICIIVSLVCGTQPMVYPDRTQRDARLMWWRV